MAPGPAAGQALFERGVRRWGPRWEIRDDRSDRGRAAVAAARGGGHQLRPLACHFRLLAPRRASADVFGLELTHLNEPMASAFVKFAEDSKQEPNPPRFIEWWRYSHPSLGRRIDFVLRYKPWGQPRQ